MVVRGIMNVAQRIVEPAAIISFSTGAYQYLGPHSIIGTGIAGGAGFLLYGVSEGLKSKLKSPAEKVQKLQAQLDKANTPKLSRKEKKMAKIKSRAAKIEAKLNKKVAAMGTQAVSAAVQTAESAGTATATSNSRHRH